MSCSVIDIYHWWVLADLNKIEDVLLEENRKGVIASHCQMK